MSFFDANIILGEVLGQFRTKIEKLKRDVREKGIACFASSSVIEECDKRITGTVNFIGQYIIEFLKLWFEEKGLPPSTQISNIDIRDLENFLNFYGRRNLLNDPITEIESWMVNELEKLRKEQPSLDINTFIVKMTAEVLKAASSVQLRYSSLKTTGTFITIKTIIPDNRIVDELKNMAGLHDDDAEHIASVSSYQLSNMSTSVFVTLDRRTVLFYKDAIFKIAKANCCDPIYAIHNV